MEKMKFETPDMAQMNVEKIAALFPNCVTESKAKDGKLKKAVNFDALKQMLGESVAEGDESYEFTWVGKRDAMVEAAKPIRKTLRPCVEESKNFDTTENLYIEGDNLEALKLLQEGYLGKVKMIYIDPPYNTGNDFIYKDDFRMDSAKYAEESGAVDDEGNRMVQNSDSNGRFHSDWCSMIYSRLLLARNLLTDDGVIFISIDDNEQANLKKICDEVFAESNCIGCFVWQSKKGGGSDNNTVVRDHEYVLSYARNIENSSVLNKIEIESEVLDKEDEFGKYRIGRELNKWGANSRREDRPTMYFPIPGPNGEKVYPIRNDGSEGCWRWGKPAMLDAVKNGNVEFVSRGDGTFIVYEKIRSTDSRYKPYRTYFNTLEVDTTTADGSKLVKSLFDDVKVFSFPKPIELMNKLIDLGAAQDNCIIMDFFSGSATTAQAILQQNAEKKFCRKFIMVQMQELCDEESEAFKYGYKTICEIGKERIRRAGDKILAEQQAKEKTAADKTDLFDSTSDKLAAAKPLDIGFRVLKIDDSNMKDVYYSAGEISQQDLVEQISNIKDGRTDMDLLFGCLVDWGVPLSLPIKTETIENLQVYNVNDGDLVACFANDIPEAAIRQIAAAKPLRAVFRDSSFKSDSAKINVTEIFKTISPNTTVKVV